MALVSVQDVRMAFGGPLLLDGVDLQVEPGERVCLMGMNGAGKSTLMKLIHGDLVPDAGEVVRQRDVRTAYLPQEVPGGLAGTVRDVVSGGADPGAGEAGRLQVERVLSRMELDAEVPFDGLSGGMKRRVLLARALARDPHLLLLDEPTNHLDIDAIVWLEQFLLRFRGTLLFVTHDRAFLRNLATRIVELDRGRLYDWACDYDTFLKRKAASLETEAAQQVLFDKKLAQEEAWIRQGIRARRTRNEGRVRALERLREVRQARRSPAGTVRMNLQEAERSGKLVVEAEGVGFGYAEVPVLRDFSVTVLRGDRVGIIGPNGSGKTTLLRLLLGELTPEEGRLRHGVRLEVVHFDQHRAQLDGDRSVQDNVVENSDMVTVNGKKRHVTSYLQDFLFTPERARTPVRALSGGERSRLLLARLFTRPSNVLAMDEPTNDLDAETLELLEDLLLEYPGTLLLVSHDRTFLNNVVTSTLALEGKGRVGEYVGGYDDWVRQRVPEATDGDPAPERSEKKPSRTRGRPRKLSYRDQQELEALPGRIEALEAEQAGLHRTLSDPVFYQQGGEEIGRAKARLDALARELEAAYARWEALEARGNGQEEP